MRNVKFFVLLLCFFSFQTVKASDAIYVLNTLGQNLSVVNPIQGTVNADAATVGLYTNDIKIHQDRIFVVNSGVNEIQVLDLNSLQTLKRYDTGDGTNPYSVEIIDDKTIAVSLLFSNEVAFIDLESDELTRISTGSGPTGLKYAGGLLFVCNTNFISWGVYGPGTIDVIDPVSKTHIDTITVGINPNLMNSAADGDYYILSTGNYADIPSKIFRINPDSREVTDSLSLNGFPALSNMTIDHLNRLFLSDYGHIYIYNLNRSEFIRDTTNAITGGPGVSVDRNGTFYTTDFNTDSLFSYDADLNRTGAWLTGDGPLAIALHPDLQTSLGVSETQKNMLPQSFSLLTNYPNPFNGNTTIRYMLNQATPVELSVYSINGQKVATLFDGFQQPGVYSIRWMHENVRSQTASMTYIVKLKTRFGSTAGKISYIK